jgi:hypothetical protein
MGIEVVTKEDLQQFRLQLLNDLRQLLEPKDAILIKPWLRNAEVRKLLNISSNTIQRLRISGKLRSTKIGGIHYYKYEDIEKLFNIDTA